MIFSVRTFCKFKERAVNLGGQGADVLGRACQAEAQNRPVLGQGCDPPAG